MSTVRTTALGHNMTSRAIGWAVMALSSLLVLSACTTETTIDTVDRSPATVPTPAAPVFEDEPDTTPEPQDSTESTPDTDDPAPDNPAPPTDDGGDARFVLEGELPLTTAEVNELIAFVEDDTGRPFLRPPVIVAQSNEEFLEVLSEDLDEFDADAEVSIRTLQALGLTDRGVEEVAASFRNLLLSPEGILGYYDADVDHLVVPVGVEADDSFRALLVHELTHALDGQYADLTVLDGLLDIAEETGDYEPIITLRTVVEGRASSVETRWRSANDAPQEVPEDLGAAAAVPPALLLDLSLPYAFGEQFIELNGGASETWAAIENPPPSSEAFMVPGTPPTEAIVQVETPAAEGPILQEAVYGASDIFVWLLGESLEPDTSLIFPTFTAIDGWAGGRAVLWGDDSESCIRIAIAADTEADLGEFQQAIAPWADASADRSVVIEGGLVVATGCAPYLP